MKYSMIFALFVTLSALIWQDQVSFALDSKPFYSERRDNWKLECHNNNFQGLPLCGIFFSMNKTVANNEPNILVAVHGSTIEGISYGISIGNARERIDEIYVTFDGRRTVSIKSSTMINFSNVKQEDVKPLVEKILLARDVTVRAGGASFSFKAGDFAELHGIALALIRGR